MRYSNLAQSNGGEYNLNCLVHSMEVWPLTWFSLQSCCNSLSLQSRSFSLLWPLCWVSLSCRHFSEKRPDNTSVSLCHTSTGGLTKYKYGIICTVNWNNGDKSVTVKPRFLTRVLRKVPPCVRLRQVSAWPSLAPLCGLLSEPPWL